MNKLMKINSILPLAILFIVVPILFYANGDIPRRSLLQEFISITTILSLCLMLAQFYITRTHRRLLRDYSIASIVTIHKIIGYIFLSLLLVHPFLLVLPRFFTAGIDSVDAFKTIITTFSSLGVVLGICSWCLALILGATTLLRKKLPLRYTTWRLLHGVLAILFTVLGAWHAVDLGRHLTSMLSYYVILAAVSGVLPLLKTYIFQSPMAQGVNK